MKITVFNGSSKAEAGNTQFMVDAFGEGATAAGAEIETVFLVKKNYKGCQGCFHCWMKTPGKCIFDDDVAEMLEKFKESDIVVFATPLYVDNVSGLMKNFMDRLIPIADPHIETDENGEAKHVLNHKLPKLGVISNCGFPEQSHFQVLRLLFPRIARNLSTEVAFEIYRGCGAILGNAPMLLKPLLWKYKKMLSQAGREVVENGGISEGLQKELEKPFIPANQYIAAANKIFDAELAKIK
jgi:putative NADPH-quinone reductase